MSRTVSDGMLKAINLIRTKGMTPWAAAKEVGIEDTTVYRSPLYLQYLNETDGPIKAAEAMRRLQAAPAWGGSDETVTPQSVAKDLRIPIQLIYNAHGFQERVMELLRGGYSLEAVSDTLRIPVVAIKKLPRYMEQLNGDRVSKALAVLEAAWAGGSPALPQDVAKQIKISVNSIYRSEQFQRRVEAMLDAGVSLRQISEKLGIGHRAIKALPLYASYARGAGRPSTSAEVRKVRKTAAKQDS